MVMATFLYWCPEDLPGRARLGLGWDQPAKQNYEASDSYGHIGLIFDGVAQCLLKGTGRLPCGIGSGIGDLRGGIRYFICDVACSTRIGVVWCQRANVSESSLPVASAGIGLMRIGAYPGQLPIWPTDPRIWNPVP